jgi:hypothetical protein
MPPDHDHFNGSVNLDDAGSVMREIVSPIPVGLRRIPDRETRPWLVPARPQPGLLAGLTVDPGSELSFALVPYPLAEQARGST